MYQTSPPLSPPDALPTMYDLPSEDRDEPGLPDEFHLLQTVYTQVSESPPNPPWKGGNRLQSPPCKGGFRGIKPKI